MAMRAALMRKRLEDSPVADPTTREARAKVKALDPRTRKAIESTLKQFKKFGVRSNYVTK